MCCTSFTCRPHACHMCDLCEFHTVSPLCHMFVTCELHAHCLRGVDPLHACCMRFTYMTHGCHTRDTCGPHLRHTHVSLARGPHPYQMNATHTLHVVHACDSRLIRFPCAVYTAQTRDAYSSLSHALHTCYIRVTYVSHVSHTRHTRVTHVTRASHARHTSVTRS